MRKKWIFLLGLFIIGVIFLFFYIKSTPQYSLFKVYQSVKKHDYTTFSKFVDVDTLVDSLVDKSLEESKKQREENNSSSEWEELGNSFADGLVTLMKPTLVSTIKSSFQKNIESGDFEFNYQSKDIFKFIKDMKIKKDGNLAVIVINDKDNNPLNIKMRKIDNYWQIFDMDIDLSNINPN